MYQYVGSAWRFAMKEDPVAGRKFSAFQDLTFCIYTKSKYQAKRAFRHFEILPICLKAVMIYDGI